MIRATQNTKRSDVQLSHRFCGSTYSKVKFQKSRIKNSSLSSVTCETAFRFQKKRIIEPSKEIQCSLTSSGGLHMSQFAVNADKPVGWDNSQPVNICLLVFPFQRPQKTHVDGCKDTRMIRIDTVIQNDVQSRGCSGISLRPRPC